MIIESEKVEDVLLGREMKMTVSIDPIDGKTMNDYNFKVEVFARGKAVVFEKRDMKRIDDSNYSMVVDTRKVGTGRMKVVVTAYIPDTDSEDMVREEPVLLDPKVNIIDIKR